MARRPPFWCGDDCFRYCVVRRILQASGYTTIIPASPPNAGTLRLPRRGSSFSHQQATGLLAERGCPELARIDEAKGVRPRARGDIDVLASRDSEVLVLEVKTRIVPRTFRSRGLWAACDFLRYHLDEPTTALSAWEALARKGIVEERMDNPSSISELVREAVASLQIVSGAKRLTIGSALPFYASDLAQCALESLERAARYLEQCLGTSTGYVLLVIHVDRLGHPRRARTQCLGDSCWPLTGEWVELEEQLIRQYRGCGECPHRGFCGARFRG